MKSRLLACFLSLLALPAFSQVKKVTGSVADAIGPLTGVSVVEQGTTNGVVTMDGKYEINVAEGKTLVFSCIGYKEVTVVIGKENQYDVTMVDDTELLEEVVVIGYGTVKKKDLTGSVSSVNSDKLKETVSVNVDQMLQGKVAGVQITQNSGAPGASTSIRVRGASSINNTNEPLYIVDGIPFSGAGNEISGFDWAGGTNGQNVVNPLSTISPNDIVSIDVLKDASATAIYGANGANGVVIITTRRGQAGHVNITYDGYVSAQAITNRLKMMNLREYAHYQAGICEDFGQTLNDYYKDPSLLGEGTDWQDEIFRTAWMHSHSVSISGGTEKIRVAASAGYANQDGVIIGSGFSRFNARVNLDADITKWLSAGASLSFAHTNEIITNNDGADGVVMQALTMQPSVPVYDINGDWAGPESVNGASQYNPVWLAQMKHNDYQRNRTMGNFYLSVTPYKDVNIRSEFGIDYSDNNNTCFIPTYSFGLLSSDINQVMHREDHSKYWIWKTYANYNHTWKGKHNFGAMLGWEITSNSWNGNHIIKKNLSSNNVQIPTEDGEFVGNKGWKDAATMASAFGRVNYNYAERYYITATVRGDASSKFGPRNKWGVFPSAALAWRISNEKFFEGARSAVNELKIRAGYGQVGNSNIGTYLYSSKMTSFTTPFGTAYYMANIANPDLKWEASEQYNGGIDIEFLKGRISLTVDGYYKKSKDLLLQMTVPNYLGGSTQYNDIATPMVNMGQVSNRGFDLSLTTRNIEHKKFNWSTNLIVSLNRNRVDAMSSDSAKIFGKVDYYSAFQTASVIMVGQPMGVYYGYVAEGLFMNEEEILNAPVQVPDSNNPGRNLVNKTTGVYPGDIRFKDLSGPDGTPDGVIDQYDQTIIGDPNPDFTFGFTNSFIIGNFDINLALTGAVGGDVLNFSRYNTESMVSLWDNQAATVADRAIVKDGQVVSGGVSKKYGYLMPRASINDYNQNRRMSTRWIENGSYLRIQNLSIAYRIPEKCLEKMHMSTLKVYLNAQNLYTFSKYSGYDPEIGAYNQSALLQNIDRGRYPTPLTVTLGLTIGF